MTSDKFAIGWAIALGALLIGTLAIAHSIDIAPGAQLTAVLEYANGSFDMDNNGVVSPGESIDFTLSRSIFNETPDESQLCSLWQRYEVESGQSQTYCQGNADCCAIAQTLSSTNASYTAGSWDAFVLAHVSLNTIKAQLWWINGNASIASDWTSEQQADFISQLSLISPADGFASNTSSVRFNFTGSGCLLNLNTSASVPLSPGGLATVPGGKSRWNISCGSETSESRTIFVDAQAPQVSIQSPANNANVGTVAALSFSAIDEDTLSCTVLLDGNLVHASSVLVNGTSYAHSLTVGSGAHTLLVRCLDAFNRQGEASVAFTAGTNVISLSLDKPTVLLREPFTLTATAQSGPLTLIVRRFDLLNHATLESYHTLPAPYPYQFLFNDTTFTGTYTIEARDTNNQLATASVQVANNVSATISATPPIVGQGFTLNATMAGGTPPYSFIWRLGNLTATANPWTTSLSQAGVYRVDLEQYDAFGNNRTTSYTLEARNEMRVLVTDTAGPVADARVSVDGDVAYTNASGLARFLKYDGHYPVSVSHTNYSTHQETISINDTFLREIRLNRTSPDSAAPKISFIEPAAGASVQNPLTIRASVDATGDALCKLFSSADASLWTQIATSGSQGDEVSFVTDLSLDSRYVRLECQDDQGHVGISESRGIRIDQQEDEQEPQTAQAKADASSLKGLLDTVDAQIDYFTAMDRQDREIAQTLGILKDLDETKALIIAARRTGTETGIPADVEAAKAKIPNSFNIIDRREAIAYATNQQISALAPEILTAMGGKGDAKAYAKQLQDAQGKLGVTALYASVSVTYVDGSSKTYSVVSKALTVDGEGQLFESIPKSVAQSASAVKSSQLFAIINDDPLLKFPLPADGRIAYYTASSASLDDLEQAKTILAVAPSSKGTSGSSKLTGFAFLDPQAAFGGEDSMKFWLMILVAVLMGVYLFHSLNLMDVIIPANKQKVIRSLELDKLLEQANHALDRGQPHEAGERYTEITMLFPALPASVQERDYGLVEELANKINLSFAEQQLGRIEQAIHYGALEEAHARYPDLNDAYGKLTPEHKAMISSRCLAVHERLSR